MYVKLTIRENYFGNAYLLTRNGDEIDVLNHPTENFEFESILYLLENFGTEEDKRLALEYEQNQFDYLKDQILQNYNENYCKVRVWGIFADEVTFRITSTDKFNWYNIIVEFLLKHRYTNSLITVESNKNENYRIYWNKVTYDCAVNPINKMILEKKLKRTK